MGFNASILLKRFNIQRVDESSVFFGGEFLHNWQKGCHMIAKDFQA
jgi:hypothetical protein